MPLICLLSYYDKNLVKLRSQLPIAVLPLHHSLTEFTKQFKNKIFNPSHRLGWPELQLIYTYGLSVKFSVVILIYDAWKYSPQIDHHTPLQILGNIGTYSKSEINTFYTNIWTIKSKWDCLKMRQQIYEGSPFKTVGQFSLGPWFKASGVTM